MEDPKPLRVEEKDSNRILVRHVDWAVIQTEEIRSFFEKFGNVLQVQKGRSRKPIAFITFEDGTCVYKVMQAPSQELMYKDQQLCVAKSKRKIIPKQHHSMNKWVICTDDEFCTSAKEREVSPIQKLTNELLDLIFTFLDIEERVRTERVCKRWRWIGKCQRWSSPKFLIFVPDEEDKVPMTGRWQLTDKILAAILSRCGSSLRYLALSGQTNCYRFYTLPNYRVRVTAKCLKVIGKYCYNLKEIKLKELPLNESGLKKLSQGCQKLKNVSLINCELALEDVGLSSFFKRCTTMESLTLGHFKEGSFNVPKTLKCFRVEGLRYLTPVALQEIALRCDCLCELRLSCASKGITPNLLFNLFNRFSQTLKVLDLSGHFSGFIDWRKATKILNNLEELHMYDRSPVPLPVIILPCPDIRCKNLRFLQVYSGNDYYDEFLVQVLLSNTEHLQELRLTSCFHVSPKWLKRCLKHPEIIKTVELCDLVSCTWEDWNDIIGKMANLENLFLSGCSEVNDVLVTTIREQCSKLKVLEMPYSSITDEGLSQLATLPLLSKLDITFNHGGITKNGLESLAMQGRIEQLFVSGASDEWCTCFAKYCPNFRVLNVTDAKEVTNNLVTAFSEALQVGFLKHRMALFVGNTSVTEDVERHPRLDVIFGSMRTATFFVINPYNG